jgi:phenylalanyl-tRNA synthetase beta chain
MPKIEVNDQALFRLIAKKPDREELEALLTAAKAELDDWLPAENLLKIELNDTNRPDLWSTYGLGRQLRLQLGSRRPGYAFFSTLEKEQDCGARRVLVEAGLKQIRPYIAAFVAEGLPIDEEILKDLIQSQEKLCWNYGRKRSSIAMGVYRADLMRFPVHYRAADPDATSFIPLDFSIPLTLREILARHPKGVEFGSIVSGFARFPYLEDDAGETLSFPPVINSAHLGAVQVGDSQHFIELTGTDLDSLLLACSIVACDLADAGYTIRPVKIVYPYDTPYGRELVTPFYFQKEVTVEAAAASRLLGEEISTEEAEACLEKMGNETRREGERLVVIPPPYRNDFLHPVDAIEEIMIGRGMESFAPVWPEDFTVGRLSAMEIFSRRVRETMVGLGFQEMIYNYLASRRDMVERMNRSGEQVIEIANPMSENFEVLRDSQLPNLLASEAVSGHAAYPHRIFEIGKTAIRAERENYGSRTLNSLCFLVADREAGFNDVSAQLSALFFYLSREFTLRDTEDPRFIPGRVGEIIYQGRAVGLVGEIHPAVLANWGIQMPCAGAELELDALLGE